MARNKSGVDLAGNKVRMFQRADEKRSVGAQAGDLRLFQRMRELRGGRFARVRMRNHLGDHRIVERRHRIAFAHAGIHPHHILRQMQPLQRSGGRQEIVLRIFRIQPRFDGMAVQSNLALAPAAASRPTPRAAATPPDRVR